MPFNDRSDAGRKLAKALATYKKQQPVILALPRGGVPVAAEVCAALNAPLDLVLVRKVGVPFQPELAMGAVVDGATPIIVRNEDVIQAANINEATFNAVCDAELCEIEQRRQRYLGTRDRVEVAGHTAIVIDDGIATGATMKAALHAIRARRPQTLVSRCRSLRRARLPSCSTRPTTSFVLKITEFSALSASTTPISGRFRIRK